MPYVGHTERMVLIMALDYASIGLRIKHARTQKEMTQAQLAELTDTSRNHLSLIEAGEKGISLELLISIANALQVSVSDLLVDCADFPSNMDTSELNYLLLDCTSQEEKIITKAAKALKAILSEHGV